MSFHEKYLKYKNKYISLKNMKGGAPNILILNETLEKLRKKLNDISDVLVEAQEVIA